MRILGVAMFAFAVVFSVSAANAFDERDAKGLAKENDCFKCHSVSKEKDAPPYKKIAEKYRNNPDAEAILTKHLTTTPMVKVDGKEEKHEAIKGEPDEIQNLVQWILSL